MGIVYRFSALLCFYISSSRSFEMQKLDQATSLQEAIEFFDDMSLLNENKPPERIVDQDEANCVSDECKMCRQMLRQRLKAVGLFEDIYGADGYKNFVEPVPRDTESAVKMTCDRYRFSRNDSDAIEYRKDKELRLIIQSFQNVTHNVIDTVLDPVPPIPRRKRQTVESVKLGGNMTAMLGTRYNLSCTPKGAAVAGDPQNGLISLCAKCWAWRQLPSNYFPQFVNELVCHDGDSECLSGYGGCNTAERTVEVLRNDTDKLTLVTLTAGSYCECHVQAGSPIQNLVMGTSKR